MPGMGPPPKPAGTRARRNATVAMRQLPAAGRKGKAPAWPLGDDVRAARMAELLREKTNRVQERLETCTARQRPKLQQTLDGIEIQLAVLEAEIAERRRLETALWDELWVTPQAAAWEQLGWIRDVAQYVRHKVSAEMGSLDDAKEARQWSDRLGLNPLAMLRLRWETERAEEAEHRGRQRRAVSKQASPRKTTAKTDPRRVLRAV